MQSTGSTGCTMKQGSVSGLFLWLKIVTGRYSTPAGARASMNSFSRFDTMSMFSMLW